MRSGCKNIVRNSLYRALVYNSEKINKEDGRLLATNKIYNDGTGRVNINRAYQDFKGWMPTATRTERPMVHISLNPHPEDVLTDAEFTLIAREYLEKMGFADMPYMVYKHSDIARHHIHIVALRVKTDGTCVSDRNNFYKSKDICRELEKKYGLKSAERQKITPDMPISKIDPNGDIKRQVANTVKMVGMRWKFQTLGEYNAILSLYNVRCEEADGRVNGREYHGLVYFATDDDGKTITSPFKASRLGKFSGREAIEQRYLKAKEKIDIEPTKRMVADVMNATASKEDFIAGLKEKNIDLVLRYTEEERIYGATFIDHNTKTVLNGSRLGKEFSANALEEGSTIRRSDRCRCCQMFSSRNMIIRGNPHNRMPGSHHSLATPLNRIRPLPHSRRTDGHRVMPTIMKMHHPFPVLTCSMSAPASMRRKKPSTERCSVARRKSVAA